MTEYKVYRGGNGNLEQDIKAAVTDFYSANKRLPASLVVHESVLASEVEAARAAVKVLELSLAVEGNAGPLVGECWLQVRGNNDKKAELQQAILFGEETRP